MRSIYFTILCSQMKMEKLNFKAVDIINAGYPPGVLFPRNRIFFVPLIFFEKHFILLIFSVKIFIPLKFISYPLFFLPLFWAIFQFPYFFLKNHAFHLQPNLLTFGLNAEYKPPINRRFKYKWNKFTYFLPKMFELWPFPEKRAIAFFRFFPFLRPFHSFFGSEMYETLNRTGWF